ncbi:MAG: AarF/ABC1/UbiB kinase family protein [Desulfobacterales bacterium]|nr:AarF/ABC1/UbiB kinase family protein [Desulfobacterales bacterium]
MLSIRKIGVIGRTYRHLNRYRQILSVFFRYGFGDLVERLKIDQYIEIGLQLISRKRRERIERLGRAERVRMAMEELGPTFVKLGQVLSTRPDLAPEELVKEFTKLQDKAASFPFRQVKSILVSEFEQAPEEIFHTVEEEPLASASIGQVHRAELMNGEIVAVKIQRPGIRRTIEVDLEIMLHLATLMERHIEEMSLQRPVRIVEEFARAIENEIDYAIEASNMERISRNFLGDPTVYIPRVFQEFSTSRVLTTELVDGIKVSELSKLERAGLDRKIITDRGADLCLRQIFLHGFFHADPHPGNIFVLPDNVICLLDFGMVGSVNRHTREEFVNLVEAVVLRDESRTVQVLLGLTEWSEEPSRRLLERDVADFMSKHLYKPLKEIEFRKVLHHLLTLASRHHLRMPPDIFFMLKALGTLEGVARNLDPDFDMIAKATPFIQRVMMDRFSPERIAGVTRDLFAGLGKFLQQFPGDLMEIGRMIRQRQLSVRVEDPGLQTTLAAFHQISNRLSFSIIIAALLIGSALIVISETPPLLYGISMIGIIGFFAAAIMGVWLLIAIVRKGRL